MFSIIMPTYNCERYVEEAIKSVLSQTFSDYELIIVDDGSTDETFNIVKSFEKENDNIKAYRNDHQGVSAARNTGIEHATRKYVLFMDGDDTWDNDLLMGCFESMEANCELAVFGIRSNFYSNEDVLIRTSEKDYTIDNVRHYRISKDEDGLGENLSRMFKKNNMASPCNKVYLLSLIKENNIRFSTECVFLEDLKFNLDYLCFVEKVKIIPQSYYNYRLFENQKQKLKRNFKTHFMNADAIYYSFVKLLDCIGLRKKDLSILVNVIISAYYQELLSFAYEQEGAVQLRLLKDLNKNKKYNALLKSCNGKFFTLLKVFKFFGLKHKQFLMIQRRYW